MGAGGGGGRLGFSLGGGGGKFRIEQRVRFQNEETPNLRCNSALLLLLSFHETLEPNHEDRPCVHDIRNQCRALREKFPGDERQSTYLGAAKLPLRFGDFGIMVLESWGFKE